MKWCKLIRFNLIIYDDIVLSVESLTTSRFFHNFFIYNNSILILRMQFLSSRKKNLFIPVDISEFSDEGAKRVCYV